jgi:L-iditol 2-dehydrogenase
MLTKATDFASAGLDIENPALYTTKDHRIYLAPSPALEPGADDCVVHVRANGICG